jgi:flagellar motility protein MotE (MotC chaperone)
MKITMREILMVALTMVLSFPVIYLLLMIATGAARLEFGEQKKDPKKEQEIHLLRLSAKRDSLIATQSNTFTAIEQEKASIAHDKQELLAQQEQLKIAQADLEKARQQLSDERQKLEKLVSQSDELDKKRIKQLAKVYGAMRAEEAARILETLDDDLCMNILANMGDDRQKAKILSALSGDKATRVSKKIGSPLKSTK